MVPVAVKVELILIAPPWMVIGPAMLVAEAMVMSCVLPSLPKVKPLMDDDKLRFEIGKLSALVKLVLDG